MGIRLRLPTLPVLLAILLGLACARAPDPAGQPRVTEEAVAADNAEEQGGEGAAEEPPPRATVMKSPADGVVLTRQPWVPVIVNFPPRFAGMTVQAWLDGEPWADPLAVVRARTDGHGGGIDWIAALDLVGMAPGVHRLEVEGVGPTGETSRVSSAFLYNRPPGHVRIEVRDAAGQRVEARIAVMDEHGRVNLFVPRGPQVDPAKRDTRLSSIFTSGGQAELWLPHGEYRFTAIRGPRDEVQTRVRRVSGESTVSFRLGRSLPTPGRVLADLHVHSAWSADAFVPQRLRAASLRAAGLDAFVLSDHERVSDPDLLLSGGPTGALDGVAGIELYIGSKKSTKGHINVYPRLPGETWSGERGLAGLIDGWRARGREQPVAGAGGRVLVQLNHPRGIQFHPEGEVKPKAHAAFTASGYARGLLPGQGSNAWMTAERAETGTRPLDLDAMEVMNRFSWDLYRETRKDWFSLWEAGFPIAGTGNSDSHALSVEVAGFPANLVHVPGWRPGTDLDLEAFVSAIAAGRLEVTNGPLVEVRVNGTAGPGDTVTARGGVVEIEARIRAASWVPVPEARLVVDGEVVAVEMLPRGSGEGLDRTLRWKHTLAEDGWLLVEAGWPLEDDRPVPGVPWSVLLPGHVPTGFTNPVRIDADADGDWTITPRTLEPPPPAPPTPAAAGG